LVVQLLISELLKQISTSKGLLEAQENWITHNGRDRTMEGCLNTNTPDGKPSFYHGEGR
jgi:hypothetical protein